MRRFDLSTRDGANGTRIVEVHGELDLAVTQELTDAIAAVDEPADVVIDLSACEFIDSTGIATILVARRELAASGRGLTIAGAASDQVLRILQVVGLDHSDLMPYEGGEIETG